MVRIDGNKILSVKECFTKGNAKEGNLNTLVKKVYQLEKLVNEKDFQIEYIEDFSIFSKRKLPTYRRT